VALLLLDGVLALAERVPQLDGLVARAGDDLAVVHGEGHGEDILGVADEAAGGGTGVEVPEAEGAVPGAGEGELAVGGDHYVLDEVGVTAERPLREAVVALLAGEGPQDDSLVAGGRQEHVGVGVQGAREGGNPALVAAREKGGNEVSVWSSISGV
jgi:hypothetical protein